MLADSVCTAESSVLSNTVLLTVHGILKYDCCILSSINYPHMRWKKRHHDSVQSNTMAKSLWTADHHSNMWAFAKNTTNWLNALVE